MKSHDKQIAETIPEFFFIWDLNKNKIIHITNSFDLVSINPKKKESLEDVRQIIARDELERFDKAFEEIDKGNYYQDLEFKTANVFNGKKWVNMKTFPVKIDRGDIENVAGQFIDITDKKQRQEKMERQSEEIEDILHILAHDVRGPLGNILNIARAQKVRSAEELDVITNFSALIEKIADNTLYMMESMVETIKVTSRGFEIEPTLVELKSFLNGVLTPYESSLNEKQISLDTHFPENDIHLNIDEIKFRLVMQNLLTNAIKFTLDGGHVKIELFEDKEQVIIKVADTGIGIAKENQKRIFNKFSPVRKDGVRGEKSFGLGLSISKKIVELHGGTIKVESEVDKGTTFTIKLPGKKQE